VPIQRQKVYVYNLPSKPLASFRSAVDTKCHSSLFRAGPVNNPDRRDLMLLLRPMRSRVLSNQKDLSKDMTAPRRSSSEKIPPIPHHLP
jgi:hypothetical protein